MCPLLLKCTRARWIKHSGLWLNRRATRVFYNRPRVVLWGFAGSFQVYLVVDFEFRKQQGGGRLRMKLQDVNEVSQEVVSVMLLHAGF